MNQKPEVDFFRVAAASPALRVADCTYNKNEILKQIRAAATAGAAVVIFPELAITGYTCGDLFHNITLLKGAEAAVAELMAETANLDLLCAVGVPVPQGAALYNCIAVFQAGKLLGLPAKRHLPNYGEFYELRNFTPTPGFAQVNFAGTQVPLGDMLFRCRGQADLALGFEICEDLWVTSPPALRLAENGALVILNASCSDETIGKADYRRQMIESMSARLLCAYCYADSGMGESSTDLVFAGHRIICENGQTLAEGELFTEGLTLCDLDPERLVQERRKMNTFVQKADLAELYFDLPVARETPILREVSPSPFVPTGEEALVRRCAEIVRIQAAGLEKRLSHIGAKTVHIGLSGGLDSTLALLVTVEAFDHLGLPRSGVCAVSMPCFGTTTRTKNNAQYLAEELGVSFREISIAASVLQHFKDIGHNPEVTDVTFENAQARERTQLLMDLSNQEGGIVIGTGDLSELALGWATYNGDHMSMYGVNGAVPKTLVKHLVQYFAKKLGGSAGAILLDVLDTPVSPELLPPKNGEIAQKTEDLVGPYALHDFFLYYVLRFGFSPQKIYRLACTAFAGTYAPVVVQKWMAVFYRRFFSQQFKRSCLPDGPKVGSISLSPRGDFKMPSDACVTLWLAEIDHL